MNYDEALKHKKEAVKNAEEPVKRLYHIIITPSNTDESYTYIEAFSKNPEAFDDESCKKFCTNDDYEVVSFRKDGEEEINEKK